MSVRNSEYVCTAVRNGIRHQLASLEQVPLHLDPGAYCSLLEYHLDHHSLSF